MTRRLTGHDEYEVIDRLGVYRRRAWGPTLARFWADILDSQEPTRAPHTFRPVTAAQPDGGTHGA